MTPVLLHKTQTSVLNVLIHVSSQIWLTFAPVADQSAQYLEVSLEQINWLSMVFMVVTIPLTFGTTWMMDTLGLRIMVQSSAITGPPAAARCNLSCSLFPLELVFTTGRVYLYCYTQSCNQIHLKYGVDKISVYINSWLFT